jgi:hypothetical protein
VVNESAVDGPHAAAGEKFLLYGAPPKVILHFDPPTQEDPTVAGERRRLWAWIRSWIRR